MLNLILFIATSFFIATELRSSELDQFKNTEMYVTYDHKGKPALLLGEIYELQTKKKKEDLIGKTFKFLMDDDSIKEAKIEKLEKVCYMHYGEEEYEECAYLGVQNQVEGLALAAFLTDLADFKFEWVYKNKWKKTKEIDLAKVKENIARHRGVGFKPVVGNSFEDFEKVKHHFKERTRNWPRNVSQLLLSVSENGAFASENGVWRMYRASGYGWIVLKNGELFYVGLDYYGKYNPAFAFDGEIRIGEKQFYFLRFSEFVSLTNLNSNSFGKYPLLAGTFRPMLAYIENGEFKEGIKLAFMPCLSKFLNDPCKLEKKDKGSLPALYYFPFEY